MDITKNLLIDRTEWTKITNKQAFVTFTKKVYVAFTTDNNPPSDDVKGHIYNATDEIHNQAGVIMWAKGVYFNKIIASITEG